MPCRAAHAVIVSLAGCDQRVLERLAGDGQPSLLRSAASELLAGREREARVVKRRAKLGKCKPPRRGRGGG